jgi:hypothetical protein
VADVDGAALPIRLPLLSKLDYPMQSSTADLKMDIQDYWRFI